MQENQPNIDKVSPKEQVLLIDLENCPSQIHHLLKDLAQFTQVIICYAQSGAKIPLDWLLPLTLMVNSNKLKVVKMPSAGKNAADFGICFLAGMLMQQLSAQTHFVIMSDDADLDHTIELLRSYGRTAQRLSIKRTEGALASTSEKTKSLQGYCQKLLSNSNNRPSTKTAILNSLKAYYGQDMQAAEMSFNKLLELDVITLNTNDKLVYYNNKISQLVRTYALHCN